MKLNQATIVSGVIVLVGAIAFYMLILSPKRAEVASLDEDASSLSSQVAQQDELIAFGEQARKEFPRDYGRMVVLGKAVPDQADTASLMVQLNSDARDTDVTFNSITLSANAATSETGATAPAPAPVPPTEGATAPGSTTTETTTTTVAPATEAGAANLPIGAQVGPAGLPTLPYDLGYTGGFFQIADYMGRLDSFVGFDDKTQDVKVNGRLMTVDGFAMQGGGPGSNPILSVNMMLTSYVTPSTQGLMAGATPGGPAVGGVAQATPASATVTP